MSFGNLIKTLREAIGAFDVSDTPAEITPAGPKKPAIPLKALRGYAPPTKKARLPGLTMPKKPPRIPGASESYDIKTKISNGINKMPDSKDIIRNIKDKAEKMRQSSVPGVKKESRALAGLVSEMREILDEKMNFGSKMVKSGVPKVDRQDAMAKKVGQPINMPSDLTTARAKMKQKTGPEDKLSYKIPEINIIRKHLR